MSLGVILAISEQRMPAHTEISTATASRSGHLEVASMTRKTCRMSAGRSIAARLIFGLGTNPPGLAELTGKLAVFTLSRCCCRLHQSSAQTRMNAALSGNRRRQDMSQLRSIILGFVIRLAAT